jgi:hypothetical protein
VLYRCIALIQLLCRWQHQFRILCIAVSCLQERRGFSCLRHHHSLFGINSGNVYRRKIKDHYFWMNSVAEEKYKLLADYTEQRPRATLVVISLRKSTFSLDYFLKCQFRPCVRAMCSEKNVVENLGFSRQRIALIPSSWEFRMWFL